MSEYESDDDIIGDVHKYFASKISELEGIGLSLIRVHDVAENNEALRIAECINGA